MRAVLVDRYGIGPAPCPRACAVVADLHGVRARGPVPFGLKDERPAALLRRIRVRRPSTRNARRARRERSRTRGLPPWRWWMGVVGVVIGLAIPLVARRLREHRRRDRRRGRGRPAVRRPHRPHVPAGHRVRRLGAVRRPHGPPADARATSGSCPPRCGGRRGSWPASTSPSTCSPGSGRRSSTSTSRATSPTSWARTTPPPRSWRCSSSSASWRRSRRSSSSAGCCSRRCARRWGCGSRRSSPAWCSARSTSGRRPPGLLVPLAVLGFGLCLIYAWTRSLYPCVALHAVNNAIAFGVTQDWTWQIPLLVGRRDRDLAAHRDGHRPRARPRRRRAQRRRNLTPIGVPADAPCHTMRRLHAPPPCPSTRPPRRRRPRGSPGSRPGAGPRAVAAPSLHIVTEKVGGKRATIIAGTRFRVRVIVKPFAPGQQVLVTMHRRGRTIVSKTLTVRQGRTAGPGPHRLRAEGPRPDRGRAPPPAPSPRPRRRSRCCPARRRRQPRPLGALHAGRR